MDSNTFDTIARMLDARLNRRSATHGALGMLLGGAAIGVTRSTTARKRGNGRETSRRVRREAGGPGNSACAHFCNAVFPPGRQRGQCKSEGARHAPGNLCDACETDVARFCDGVCCASGEECDGSACQGACPATWEECERNGSEPTCAGCGAGAVCAGSEGCAACSSRRGGTVCDSVLGPGGTNPETQCGPGGSFSCSCAERADGTGSVCIGTVFGCSEIEPTCETDDDCERLFPDTAWVCVRKGSCAGVADCVGDNICADPCETLADAAPRRSDIQPRVVFAD
jgi:hypothetical protein